MICCAAGHAWLRWLGSSLYPGHCPCLDDSCASRLLTTSLALFTSQGLLKLKEQHGSALQLVKLDVTDPASVKVGSQSASSPPVAWGFQEFTLAQCQHVLCATLMQLADTRMDLCNSSVSCRHFIIHSNSVPDRKAAAVHDRPSYTACLSLISDSKRVLTERLQTLPVGLAGGG